MGPPFGFQLHEQLVPVLRRDRLFRHPFAREPPRAHASVQWTQAPRQLGEHKYSSPHRHARDARLRMQAPMRFVLALPFAELYASIEILRPHH